MSDEKWECNICYATFSTARSYKVHINNPPKYCQRKNEQTKDVDEFNYEADYVKVSAYLKNTTLDKYMKIGKKQLIDKDPSANIYNFHNDMNLSDSSILELINSTKAVMDEIEEIYKKNVIATEQQIAKYTGKFGNRVEDMNFINDCLQLDRFFSFLLIRNIYSH